MGLQRGPEILARFFASQDTLENVESLFLRTIKKKTQPLSQFIAASIASLNFVVLATTSVTLSLSVQEAARSSSHASSFTSTDWSLKSFTDWENATFRQKGYIQNANNNGDRLHPCRTDDWIGILFHIFLLIIRHVIYFKDICYKRFSHCVG